VKNLYSTKIGMVDTVNSSVHSLIYCGITVSLNMHAMYLKDGNNLEGPVT
jgi:hypothetical protein